MPLHSSPKPFRHHTIAPLVDVALKVLCNRFNSWLLEPELADLRWLDLCCGNGDVLEPFAGRIAPEDIPRVFYEGFDLEARFSLGCKRRLSSLGIRGDAWHGGFSKLGERLGDDPKFSKIRCVSIINALHEVPSSEIATLLLNAIRLCASNGFVFISDIEALDHASPEPWSMPWGRQDAQKLMDVITQALRLTQQPNVMSDGDGGWYVIIDKSIALHLDQWIREAESGIIDRLKKAVEVSLIDRKNRCAHNLVNLGDAFYQTYREGLGRMPTEKVSPADLVTTTAKVTERDELDASVRDFWAFDQGLGYMRSKDLSWSPLSS